MDTAVLNGSEERLYEETINARKNNHPALEKTLRMVESAKNKIDAKLLKYGLPLLELPTFVSVGKYYPGKRFFTLPDGAVYSLPDGPTKGAYHTQYDNMILNKLCIPGTEENNELLNIYRNAFDTVNKMIGKYPGLERPLKRMRRFYAMVIDNVKKLDPDTVIHELGHVYGEKLGLNDAIGSVQAIEGLNTNFADEVSEKETTMEGTHYRDHNRKAKKVFDYLGVYTALGSIKRYFKEGFSFGRKFRNVYATATI
jgi:hypothetical protein